MNDPIHHRSGIIWDEDRGHGRYPVTRPIYDEKYFNKYVGYSRTKMGRNLTDVRLSLVSRHVDRSDIVVDIGIGCGQFVDARQPGTFGYDVNPAGIRWLLRRDLWWDPYQTPPKIVTMWDSLEHMPYPEDLLKRVATAFVSMPVYRDLGHCVASKHFRPDEHYHYFTEKGFALWMKDLGFELHENNHMEEQLGREDVGTFVFKKPWGKP